MRSTMMLLLGLTALGGCTGAAAESCRFRAERTGAVEIAAPVDRIIVRAGAGRLRVVGAEGAQRVEGHGIACASSQEILDAIRLNVRREGNAVVVETDLPDRSWNGSAYAWLDLDVTLPRSVPVEVEDSSGDAELRDLHTLVLRDSSGDAEVSGVAGLVDVTDSSGELRFERIGALRLEDSSGDVHVRTVAGDVEVRADSSGDLHIEDVGGRVHIRQDSSGSIRVLGVKGDLAIDADGSGSIVARDVGGSFTVGAKGSGDISHENVRGRISLPRR